MRSATGPVLLAVILVGAGAILWFAAGRQLRLVEAERDFVSLRFEKAAAALDELSAPNVLLDYLPGLDGRAATRLDATGRYWQSGFDEIKSDTGLPLLSANAAYRAIERDGGSSTVMVGHLDGVVKRYADVLREDPANEDAAYNYEFMVKLRGELARAKREIAGVDPASSGRTLHGDVGAPPEGTDMKQFRMIVPMLPQERREAEEAGRGSRRPRKG